MTTLKEAYARFWFISGGSIHSAWKYRKWSELRKLAETLPKMAFSAGASFERARILEVLINTDRQLVAAWLESQLKEMDSPKNPSDLK